jgi:DNA polymerase III subunit delta
VRKWLGAEPDPLRLVRLDGDVLARRPESLPDEAYAISMFGGSRSILIDAQGRDLTVALAPLFARPPEDCAIVVKAGQLKRGHPMRSAFETGRTAVAIECYSDDAKGLGAVIDGELRAAGLAIDPEARASLIASLGADRSMSRGELAKLVLFARDKGRITLDDVRSIVADAMPSPLDRLIDDAVIGDLPATAEAAAAFFRSGGDADQMIARLGSRLAALYRLRLDIEAGSDFDAALRVHGVWGSPESRRATAEAARRWTSTSIAQSLVALRAASASVRLNPGLAEVSAARMAWAVASRSRRG